MTWNYRAVRRKVIGDTGEYVDSFGIHEAYYNKGVRKPYAITKDPTEPSGETLAELHLDWTRMAEAFVHPVLDHKTRDEI